MESGDEGVLGGDPCRPEEARLQDLEADNSRLRSQLNVKDQEIEELNTKVQGLLVSYICIHDRILALLYQTKGLTPWGFASPSLQALDYHLKFNFSGYN